MPNEELLQMIDKAKANRNRTFAWGGKGLRELPPEISQLTNLTVLDLRNNHLSSLPPEISQLTNLMVLDLRNNHLSSLPPEISQLTNLMVLDLRNNQFSSLPPEISQLTNLTELDLYGNYLSSLPPEISQLTNLTRLDLGHNHLSSLPPEISHLTNLTKFDLRLNQFSSLPPEISQLTNLTELNLSNNQVSSLPSEISQLTNLTELNLSNNQVSSLPSEICQLTNLMKINLCHNHLTILPPEICQFAKLGLEGIYLRGNNDLSFPPIEIAVKGIETICQWFADMKKGTRPLNEVKMLLIGDGAAGKTSLVKQLLGEEFDQYEDTTHGINIQRWQQKIDERNIRVNIWDFGGQEIMHATHQFFLSKRSLYVLVLDGRKDERPEYWLQHIESFGGDSPVLVVLNKQDENHGFDLNRGHLQRKYPAVKGFYSTSCKEGEGVADLKKALIKELGKVQMIDTLWPQSWFAVKQRIEDMEQHYISRENYDELCAKAGLAGEENCERLVDILHDLGVAVHFKDYIINTIHVLNPVWVTNAVYKLINAKQTADRKGHLCLDCLGKILTQDRSKQYSYPAHTHACIIELMKKFELCWGIGRQAVLIPQLLPVPEPEFTFDYKTALGFVLHYQSFLPPSVMPRFLVKQHEQIKEDICWRTGTVLYDKESHSEAVVKADMEARRIYLWVNGPRRKEYLSFLWFSLREINSSFEKLNVSERIPMPDDPQVTADYQTLLNCVQDGIERYRPDGAKRAYNVKELLGLVEPTGEDEMRQLIRKIETHFDEKESTAEAGINLFELKPNFFGIGLNLNELFAKQLGAKKRK